MLPAGLDVVDYPRAVHRQSGAVYRAQPPTGRDKRWLVYTEGTAPTFGDEIVFDKRGISRGGLVLVRAGESLSARLADGRALLHVPRSVTPRAAKKQGQRGFFRAQPFTQR